MKKKNGKWRMCVDYSNLNKACPKDPFGLPRIDQVVDFTAGCELLCFLDAYSGYHQVSVFFTDNTIYGAASLVVAQDAETRHKV